MYNNYYSTLMFLNTKHKSMRKNKTLMQLSKNHHSVGWTLHAFGSRISTVSRGLVVSCRNRIAPVIGSRYSEIFQGWFTRTPKDMGPPHGKQDPYYSHIFRDSYGSGMGIVIMGSGKLTIRGSHYWGSLKIPLKLCYPKNPSPPPMVFHQTLRSWHPVSGPQNRWQLDTLNPTSQGFLGYMYPSEN